MADEKGGVGSAAEPIRLMTFVSEEQLEESRKNRGVRVEDGTAQRDRSLFEILKENKDKKDAEFNERFKHRPPKALDEEETEFLDNWEMTRREYEQQLADKEAQELRSFQAAVAAQSLVVQELTETPLPKVQDKKVVAKKNHPRPYAMVVKVKPQAKKAKVNSAEPLGVTDTHENIAEGPSSSNTRSLDTQESPSVPKTLNIDNTQPPLVSNGSLVSYSDESEDDD